MLNLSRSIGSPKLWNKKKSQRCPLFFISLFLISLLFFFFLSTFTSIPKSLFANTVALSPHCKTPIPGDKFLWYAPHSGFSNQLSEFKNALLMPLLFYLTTQSHWVTALSLGFRVLKRFEFQFGIMSSTSLQVGGMSPWLTSLIFLHYCHLHSFEP